MNLLAINAEQGWQLVGWTMCYFLAIGTAVAIMGGAIRFALRNASPQARYGISLTTFAVLVFLPVEIGVWLLVTTEPTPPAFVLPETGESHPQVTISAQMGNSPNQDETPFTIDSELDQEILSKAVDAGISAYHLPTPITYTTTLDADFSFAWLSKTLDYLPWVWIVGAPATFLLLATGLVGSHRLRRQSHPLDAGPIAETCLRLRETLGIGRHVGLAVCDRIVSPLMIGIIKPMILLPPAAVTGWSPEQLEMVLLHELAHVRRWDNLVNLLQRTAEAILFYHPAIWIISRQVRLDREECCDAVVVHRTSKPQAYAELLVDLATSTQPLAGLAMASHPLTGRVRRILNLEDETMLVSRSTLSMIAVMLLSVCAAFAWQPAGTSQAEDAAPTSTEDVTEEKATEADHAADFEAAEVVEDQESLPELPADNRFAEADQPFGAAFGGTSSKDEDPFGGAFDDGKNASKLNTVDLEFLLPSLTFPDPEAGEIWRETQLRLVKSKYVIQNALKNLNPEHFSMLESKENPAAWIEKHLEAELSPLGMRLRLRGPNQHSKELLKILTAIQSSYVEITNKVSLSTLSGQDNNKTTEDSEQATEDFVLDKNSSPEEFAKLFKHFQKQGRRPSYEITPTGIVIHIKEKNGSTNTIAGERMVVSKDGNILIQGTLNDQSVNLLDLGNPAPPAIPVFLTLEQQKSADLAYKRLGVELEQLGSADLERVKAMKFEGGLHVSGAHGLQTLKNDDLLVGLHVWPVKSLADVATILKRKDIAELSPLKFYVIRRERVYDSEGVDFGGLATEKLVDKLVTGRIVVKLPEDRSILQPANPPSGAYSLPPSASSTRGISQNPGPQDQLPILPPTNTPNSRTFDPAPANASKGTAPTNNWPTGRYGGNANRISFPGPPVKQGAPKLIEEKLSPGDNLLIRCIGTLPDEPVNGEYIIESMGTVALGPSYGRAKVAGLTVLEAEAAIKKQLLTVLKKVVVQVSLVKPAPQRIFQSPPGIRPFDPSEQNPPSKTAPSADFEVPSPKQIDSANDLYALRDAIRKAEIEFRYAAKALNVSEQNHALLEQRKEQGELDRTEINKSRLEMQRARLQVERAQAEVESLEEELSRREKIALEPRYNGKTFDEWRDELYSELNHGMRAVCINALAVFTRAGKGKEAAEAILDVAEDYKIHKQGLSAGSVQSATYNGLRTEIPINIWLPMLNKKYIKNPTHWENYIVQLLPLRSNFETHAEQIALLQKIVRNESSRQAPQALVRLVMLDRNLENKEVVEMLEEFLYSDDPKQKAIAIRAAVASNKAHPEVVRLSLVDNAELHKELRSGLESGSRSFKKEFIREMQKALEESSSNENTLRALRNLGVTGQYEKLAEEILKDYINHGHTEIQVAAAVALQKISDGKESVSELLDEKGGTRGSYDADEELLKRIKQEMKNYY